MRTPIILAAYNSTSLLPPSIVYTYTIQIDLSRNSQNGHRHTRRPIIRIESIPERTARRIKQQRNRIRQSLRNEARAKREEVGEPVECDYKVVRIAYGLSYIIRQLSIHKAREPGREVREDDLRRHRKQMTVSHYSRTLRMVQGG